MSLSFKLALRYLRSRMQRTILTTLAVVFGILILFGMNGILKPMMDAFRQNIMTSSGHVDLSIMRVDGNGFDESAMELVNANEGVQQATGILRRNVLLPVSLGGATNAVTGVSTLTVTGLDVTTALGVSAYSTDSGEFLSAGQSGQIVISRSVADKMDLGVGDTIVLPSSQGTQSFEVVGVLTAISALGSDEVYLNLAEAQALLHMPGQINMIEILYTSGADAAGTQQAILTALGPNFQAGESDVSTDLLAALEMGNVALSIFGVMALAMSAFIIFNTFRTVVAERRRDLGMLRAVGASRRTVLGIFLFESLIQGAIGTALGMLLGWLFALGVMQIAAGVMQNFMRLTMQGPSFPAWTYFLSIGMGVGVTVASAVIPAFQAARITPMEALRPQSAAAYEKVARRSAVIGAVLIPLSMVSLLTSNFGILGASTLTFLLGLVLVAPAVVQPVGRVFGKLLGFLFAREGVVAQGNLLRQPNRAAITATVMMFCVAVIIALGNLLTSVRNGFTGYIETSLGADLLVMPSSMVLSGGNLGAGPELADALRNMDGIDEVTTLRLATSETLGTGLQLIGIDPATYGDIAGLEFSQGTAEEAFAALGQGRALIVNGIFASQHNLHVGDTLTMATAQGEQAYQVVGVGMDYLNAKLATAYISQANLAEDFLQTTDILLEADITPGADREAVRGAAADIVAAYPAFSLLDSESFRNSQMQMMEKMMAMLYLMMLFLSIPGLIAMINTLAINVMERRHEFGVMRAVGATKNQVSRMVLAESLLLASLGTLLGLAAGIWLGYVLVGAINMGGFVMTYYFPTSELLLGLVMGVIFGVVSATSPARLAARTEIITALRYE